MKKCIYITKVLDQTIPLLPKQLFPTKYERNSGSDTMACTSREHVSEIIVDDEV
jgi:hypothetical protein